MIFLFHAFNMKLACLFATIVLCSSAIAEEKSQSKTTDSATAELTPEAQRVADELVKSLPENSEARAMLDQILAGSRLGPGEGWFRLALSQTRFDWDYVCRSYDKNENSDVTPEEFSGTQDDFVRLDLNGDRVLTPADFDWREHSLTRTPGFMMFFQADRDTNGKLTRDEFLELFDSLDSDSRGFLSLNDLREQFQPPEEQPRNSRPEGPDPSTLVIALRDQEIGSLQAGPNLDEVAPDFTLTSLAGDDVTLSEQIGTQPVVLIFGNFTCGPFRSHAGNLEKLYARYRDRAKFFLVYVREAHPEDGWKMSGNQRVGINILQPIDDSQRRQVAETCQQHLKLEIPFLVDAVDDRVGATYSGMPNRFYLIDREGKIAFKNGRGPFGFHPRQLEQNLLLLLNQTEQIK